MEKYFKKIISNHCFLFIIFQAFVDISAYTVKSGSEFINKLIEIFQCIIVSI